MAQLQNARCIAAQIIRSATASLPTFLLKQAGLTFTQADTRAVTLMP